MCINIGYVLSFSNLSFPATVWEEQFLQAKVQGLMRPLCTEISLTISVFDKWGSASPYSYVIYLHCFSTASVFIQL